MSERGARVLEEALALSPEERADLAERLICSLDADWQRRIDELWAAEVEARFDAYERGEVEAIPADEAIADAIKKARG
ncbi:MAG: addiction module protein [Planctomycetes bacterium]|nr:addiction module protein [Planctomycetota bacterium]